jgi:AraC-like DNA-binding protein
MIVARLTDPSLRKAICLAASREEEIFFDPELAADALQRGFPRLLVRAQGFEREEDLGIVATVDLDERLLSRWEAARRVTAPTVPRVDYLARRLRSLFEERAEPPSWVDGGLADLSRAAGLRLPFGLRAFGRRILEFPAHYTSLYPLARRCRLSPGALKARFRRRGLDSPYVYLRWFRLIAVAALLSDRSVTVASGAHRLGFTSGGNLCRTMAALASMTPTEVRTSQGWTALLISFAWAHLTPEALAAWSELEGTFALRVA